MRRPRNSFFDDRVLIGAIVALAMLVVVLLSYYANTGLPFVPTYDISVAVPNAERLNVGAQVKVGGARVGIVKKVTAVPGEGGARAHAVAELALQSDFGPLPVDSTVTLRPQSVLGGKYLALVVGQSNRTLAAHHQLPLTQAVPTVEIEDALRIFDPATRRALAATVRGYGDGLAARGVALNQTIGSFAHAIGPIDRVTGVLAQPETGLRRFIDSVLHVSTALEPVSGSLGPLLDDLAPTLVAARGPQHSLARAIAAGPQTEAVADRSLDTVIPALDRTTSLLRSARAGARHLPALSGAVAATFSDARPALRATPAFGTRLQTTLRALDKVARAGATSGALRVLTTTVRSLRPTLDYVLPAQTVCNALGLFLRNTVSAGGEGDAAGPWNRVGFLVESAQTLQSATQDPDLHYNPYPHENAQECEAGNEPFKTGHAFGSPAGNQSTKVDKTAPPAAATALARSAGLLVGGAR